MHLSASTDRLQDRAQGIAQAQPTDEYPRTGGAAHRRAGQFSQQRLGEERVRAHQLPAIELEIELAVVFLQRQFGAARRAGTGEGQKSFHEWIGNFRSAEWRA